MYRITECIYTRSLNKNVIKEKKWPREIRRVSAAARVLGLWVQSYRGHGCLSVVSVLCCQVEVSATS
jgi:hypothetical protein